MKQLATCRYLHPSSVPYGMADEAADFDHAASRVAAKAFEQVPIFENFDQTELEHLCAVVRRLRFVDEVVVFSEGHPASGMFIVVSGRAIVTKADGKGGEIELCELGPGDYIGETCLWEEGLRTCSLTSAHEQSEPGTKPRETDSRVTLEAFYLSREDYLALYDRSRLFFGTTPRQLLGPHLQPDKTPLPDYQALDPQDLIFIRNSFRCSSFISSLNENVQEEISQHCVRLNVTAGERIITQDFVEDKFFIVESGTFEVYKDQLLEYVTTVDTLTCFNETALVHPVPSSHTVVAVDDGTVWVIPHKSVRSILEEESRAQLESRVDFIDRLKSLEKLTPAQRDWLTEGIQQDVIPNGTTLMSPIQVCEDVYLLMQGTLTVFENNQRHTISAPPLYVVGEEFFNGLHTENKTTMDASGPIACLVLRKTAIEDLFGSLEEGIQENDFDPRHFGKSLGIASLEPDIERHELAMFMLGDIHVVARLGAGSRGPVLLVKQEGQEGELYAMKYVDRASSITCNITSLRRLKHPFIGDFLGTLTSSSDEPDAFVSRPRQEPTQDDSLFLLYRPHLGGDLLGELRKRCTFSVQASRYYAAVCISALDYLHSRAWVYRQLRSENVLLDEDGTPRLRAPEYSKQMSSQQDRRTFTVCGVADYFAPEIVTGAGYGAPADYWALGCLMYELLHGRTPFASSDPMRTYANILRGQIQFSGSIDTCTREIICGLLHPKPYSRLGVVRGASELQEHTWFDGFDWKQLASGRMQPPFIPEPREQTPVDLHLVVRKTKRSSLSLEFAEDQALKSLEANF